MLRRLRVANFCSIREPLELSFITTSRGADSDHFMSTADGLRASRLSVMVGPNGSGKTTILKSIAFLYWFAANSFRDLKPSEHLPFQPHATQQAAPTRFEAEFEFHGVIWRYQLSLSSQRVLHESLHRREKARKNWNFVYLFKRDWIEATNSYEIKKKPAFDLPMPEAIKARQNASLVSTAAQYGVKLAVELAQMPVVTNVTEDGKYSFQGMNEVLQAGEFFHHQDDIHQQMNRLLSGWDLGLSETRVVEQLVPDEQGKDRTFYMPFGVHEAGKNRFQLPFFLESSGTRAAFVLLSKILPVLRDGGLVVIDELESDLHSHMLTAVADLFFSPNTNPKGAQLICSSHNHEILHQLHKEQIVLVEKDDSLSTDAWRLDEVEGVRSDDNYYAKYLAGAYGAIPEL